MLSEEEVLMLAVGRPLECGEVFRCSNCEMEQ